MIFLHWAKTKKYYLHGVGILVAHFFLLKCSIVDPHQTVYCST